MATLKRGYDLQGAIVRCTRKGCRTVILKMDAITYRDYTNCFCLPSIFCLACRGICACNAIYGHYVAEETCGSKCRNAIGPSCDCSCGGVRHGDNFAAPVLDFYGDADHATYNRDANKMRR